MSDHMGREPFAAITCHCYPTGTVAMASTLGTWGGFKSSHSKSEELKSRHGCSNARHQLSVKISKTCGEIEHLSKIGEDVAETVVTAYGTISRDYIIACIHEDVTGGASSASPGVLSVVWIFDQDVSTTTQALGLHPVDVVLSIVLNDGNVFFWTL